MYEGPQEEKELKHLIVGNDRKKLKIKEEYITDKGRLGLNVRGRV